MDAIIRPVKTEDESEIFRLYKKVAKTPGGIARFEHEITEEYIKNNLEKSLKNGVSFVVEAPSNHLLIAEIHASRPFPEVFHHILSDLTIVVDPDFQGEGIGKKLFTSFLEHIENQKQDILRVELIARESNTKAIHFYEKLGFNIEGRFENRIYTGEDNFEADIPMAWFNTNYRLS